MRRQLSEALAPVVVVIVLEGPRAPVSVDFPFADLRVLFASISVGKLVLRLEQSLVIASVHVDFSCRFVEFAALALEDVVHFVLVGCQFQLACLALFLFCKDCHYILLCSPAFHHCFVGIAGTFSFGARLINV